MVTKSFLIGMLMSTPLMVTPEWAVFEPTERAKVVIVMVLVIFMTLIIPNLFLSFISISCSTGLNKKLLKVILNCPAAWMLPIATTFTIGPYKSNCCCHTNANRNYLGLSKCYSGVNILLSLIIYVALIFFFALNSFTLNILLAYHLDFLFIWSLTLVIGLVFSIIYLNMDKQCCSSTCCCKHSNRTVHVMNVNQEDLQVVTIEND